MSAKEINNLDYSKSELEYKNIILPQTIFTAKWQKDKGFSVGIANTKLTIDYPTLNEALDEVGLEVVIDNEGEEILKQKGDIDYELIARIVATLIKQFDEMKVKEELL